MLPIPNGWRELNIGETILRGDKLRTKMIEDKWDLVENHGWCQSPIKIQDCYKHLIFIRKIPRIKFDDPNTKPIWK
jgi:hypothetical protein